MCFIINLTLKSFFLLCTICFHDKSTTEIIFFLLFYQMRIQWILHDWNEEECVKLLKRCKEAITINDKKGKVIIIDFMVENQKENEKSTETQLFFDMVMMVLVKGKERTEKEWAKLFLDAGFSDYKITPILGLRALIEVYP